MDALDLTKQAPRAPRELLPGLELLMMARTVDKLRATLPGGNLGNYQIPGFSARLLEALGIGEASLRDAVAAARSDDDVVAWIRRNSDPARYAQVNVALESRKVADRLDDPAFVAKYPIIQRLPPEMPLLDMLVADDRLAFEPAS
ncbi:MAG TPA: DUF5069 domain-containing protein [Candidatus Tumulicola sp.]|nr:DUF5069 domain-containing protein [Candidatus Tumulicola sp.]